jgi:hypothetical protein
MSGLRAQKIPFKTQTLKTKIILLGAYLVFMVIAVLQWREAGSALATQLKAIESYGQISDTSPTASNKITFRKLASAAQGEANVAYYLAERSRLFVLLSLALTLPLSVHLAASFRAQKKPDPLLNEIRPAGGSS